MNAIRPNSNTKTPIQGGYTALHLAAKEGFQAMVVLLLKHKAPIDACTKQGFTPLHLAARNNHKNVAEVLLTNKCNQDPHSKVRLA